MRSPSSNILGDQYVTEYIYRDPVFDGRDSSFLGFQKVREISPGDVNTLVNRETTFYYATCGAQAGTPCQNTYDDPQHSFRGLPVLTEVFNGVPVKSGDLV